jgi:hypothetical protein
MEYLVKSNTRWDNGSFFRTMSFDDIVRAFTDGGGEDTEIDNMISKVANLEVSWSYSHDFFMNQEYTFKRIK